MGKRYDGSPPFDLQAKLTKLWCPVPENPAKRKRADSQPDHSGHTSEPNSGPELTRTVDVRPKGQTHQRSISSSSHVHRHYSPIQHSTSPSPRTNSDRRSSTPRSTTNRERKSSQVAVFIPVAIHKLIYSTATHGLSSPQKLETNCRRTTQR